MQRTRRQGKGSMTQANNERVAFWVLIGVETLLLLSIVPAVLWLSVKLPEF